MHHMEFAFGFFSYLVDWFGFSGDQVRSTGSTYNVNYGPIAG
jgi:hypothetical protein